MALLAAAIARDVARLRELLAGGAPLEARGAAASAVGGVTAFLWACLTGQAECAEALLAAGCDAAAASNDGRTALMLAVIDGHAALLPLLLAAGAPLEARDEFGATAFLFACEQGQAECAEALLAAGCDAAAACNDGRTALMLAVIEGHAALLPLLLAAGATPVDHADEDGATPLWIACEQGHEECARLLLRHGVAVERANEFGATPLRIACTNGHDAVVRLLLQHGVAVDRADEFGATPLYDACRKGHDAVVRLLARHGASPSGAPAPTGVLHVPLQVLHDRLALHVPLQVLHARGDRAVLAAWLAAVDGFTPLHWACESRDPARVLAALRGDTVSDAGARCGITNTGPTALELTSRPEAFPHAPSPVRKETAALVREALAPWSPITHRVQTAAFRRAVFAVMCVGQRLRAPVPACANGHTRARSRCLGLARVPPCAGLPDDLWMAVLACCGRGWWTT